MLERLSLLESQVLLKASLKDSARPERTSCSGTGETG